MEVPQKNKCNVFKKQYFVLFLFHHIFLTWWFNYTCNCEGTMFLAETLMVKFLIYHRFPWFVLNIPPYLQFRLTEASFFFLLYSSTPWVRSAAPLTRAGDNFLLQLCTAQLPCCFSTFFCTAVLN